MGGFVFSIMFAFVMWMAAIAMAIMAVIAICALMNYILKVFFCIGFLRSGIILMDFWRGSRF